MNGRSRRGMGLLIGMIALPTAALVGPLAAQSPKSSARKSAARDVGPKFSREIAPVLVANCVRCHNPEDKARRKNLDLTTFNGLRNGGDDGPVVAPGKPSESLLVQRVKGEGGPKMPPGQNDLAESTIKKLEDWIKAGARLDVGIDPNAELTKIAPTPEDLRRMELAELAPAELEKRLEDTGLARWGKATSQAPTITRGAAHFLLFSTLPEDRSKALLKTLETQFALLSSLLGPAAGKALGGPEKISLYIFTDTNAYAEFIRGVEGREVDLGNADDQAHANLAVEAPYVVALDPLKGGPEPASSSSRKAPRVKREAESKGAAVGPRRSLVGLVTEQFVSEAVGGAGTAPPWLRLGLGAYFAAQVEPGSPYYRELRGQVAVLTERGWRTQTRDALAPDAADTVTARAVGFSLIECLASTARRFVGPFSREMLQRPREFDTMIQEGLGYTPDQFFQGWQNWAMRNYGRGR